MKTKAQRVDIVNNATDLEVAILGSLGFSYGFIRSRTGYTGCQVGYRLRAAECRVTDYRNGRSFVAGEVMKSARTIAETAVVQRVQAAHRKLKKEVKPKT